MCLITLLPALVTEQQMGGGVGELVESEITTLLSELRVSL